MKPLPISDNLNQKYPPLPTQLDDNSNEKTPLSSLTTETTSGWSNPLTLCATSTQYRKTSERSRRTMLSVPMSGNKSSGQGFSLSLSVLPLQLAPSVSVLWWREKSLRVLMTTHVHERDADRFERGGICISEKNGCPF